ncbi:hypothetical protein [Methylobacterium sp. sgz302541]|uniref:hypothetical protein n=1 Tax=unclassified Methylobacterium TaxID=2615210 RepID=UPI003D344B27
MPLADSIIGAESGGNATARNPRSSATGAGQFIAGTWLDMVSRYRPDLAGLPRDQVLGLRNDPGLSKEMVQHYADENGAKLRAAGLPDNDGSRYLSHFAGPAGAQAVLSADPSTPVAQILTPDAIAANPFTRSMTAGDLTLWASKKVGGDGSPAPAAMTMPGEAPTPGAFGLSGPTQVGAPFSLAPAGAAAMTAPTEPAPADDGPDFAALLKSLGGLSGTGQTAQGQGQQQGDTPIQPLPTRQPRAAQFDPTKFFALLPGRRAPV